jgi:hypothetical protein
LLKAQSSLQKILNCIPFKGTHDPFNVKQACMAASLNCCCRPRLPLGGGVQTISGSNQIDNDPRCFKLSL